MEWEDIGSEAEEREDRETGQGTPQATDGSRPGWRGGGKGESLLDRTKQINRFRKNAKRVGKFLKEHGPRLGRQGKEVKSNVTDNESANVMSSHGTIQGYNGQAQVDSKHQVIVHAVDYNVILTKF
jgi:hypothetical protein